jgi:hypothetical protein
MEELLKKLGAENYNRHMDRQTDWELKRVGGMVVIPIETKIGEWLLIGEITEALRERGWKYFAVWYEEDGTATLSLHRQVIDAMPKFNADTLLDCYIAAGMELLATPSEEEKKDKGGK